MTKLSRLLFNLLFITLCTQGFLMSATIKHLTISGVEIPVIFEQDNALPTFNMQLVFKNSGYIQDKKRLGLANISAKLLNEGTKELGSVKFAQKLENRAISLSASNGFETFVIELSSLKSESTTGLKLLKDLLASPNYDKNVLDKIKTTQIGVLKRKENDYDYVAKNNLKKLIFKDTALENPSSGTIESISSIKVKDIKAFLDSSITLSNLIVVAGGEITFEELEKQIKKLLTNLPKGKQQELKTISIKSKPQIKEEIKETEQAYIYFASPFFMTSQDQHTYLAKVASFILGGSGFGSRLMEEIRVKRGLAYSAYGYISVNKSHTYFTGYLQTKLESAKEAQELVQELVNEFVQNGVTQKELESAKKFLLGSEPLRTETLSQRLNRAFTYYYRGLGANFAELELEKIEKVELEELNNFIKSHQEIEQLTFSIVRK